MYGKVLIVLNLALAWTSSSSDEPNRVHVRLDVTLLQSNCSITGSCGDKFQCCNETGCQCCPRLSAYYNDCTECSGNGESCNSNRECCGPQLYCDGKMCKEIADTGLDFVTVAKIALAAALIITMIAVCSVCWKAFLQNRCSALIYGRSEGDSTSVNSMQRYILERMEDRPPRYSAQFEKPPSYEECLEACGSSTEPPPYTIVITNSSEENSPSPPPPYVLSDAPPPPLFLPTPLNVHTIYIRQNSAASGEECIASPLADMDDFVVFSETDSASSFNYDSLHSDSQTTANSEHSSGIWQPIKNNLVLTTSLNDYYSLSSDNQTIAGCATESVGMSEGIDNATYIPDDDEKEAATSLSLSSNT